MRSARKATTRVGAVVLAATFTVVTPGFGTAVAQEDGAEAPERPAWAPAGEPGSPPKDSGKPDEIYLQQVQCVQSSTEGHQVLGENELTRAPQAQLLLELNDVHKYVKNRSPHNKIGWNDKKNRPLRVAVIDTGVNKDHPFFGNRVKGGGDYVGGKAPNVPEAAPDTKGTLDCDGHGTQVAGIIGADPEGDGGREDIAFKGVAPDVEIISIRQSSQNYDAETDDQRKQRIERRKREREQAQAKRDAERRARDLEEKAEALKKRQEDLERRQQEEDTDSSAARQQDGEGEGDPRGQGSGAGNQGTLAQAVVNAANRNVDVINMSVDACRPNLGDGKTFDANGNGNHLDDDEAKLRAAIRYAVDKKDVVVVTAAGNVGGNCVQNDQPEPLDPQNPDGPKRMPSPNQPPTIVTPPWFSEDLLAVAAVDGSGAVAPFSMRGPWVNIAAPGTEITSVDPAGGSNSLVNIMFDGKEATRIQGTSFAAPYVAGLAVLVRQIHPDLTAREVMDRIMWTAQHPGARDGRDQFVGYGLINPMAALTTDTPIKPESVKSQFSSDMPPLVVEDEAPMNVALIGTAGGIGALLITMFVVRTVKRRRDETE